MSHFFLKAFPSFAIVSISLFVQAAHAGYYYQASPHLWYPISTYRANSDGSVSVRPQRGIETPFGQSTSIDENFSSNEIILSKDQISEEDSTRQGFTPWVAFRDRESYRVGLIHTALKNGLLLVKFDRFLKGDYQRSPFVPAARKLYDTLLKKRAWAENQKETAWRSLQLANYYTTRMIEVRRRFHDIPNADYRWIDRSDALSEVDLRDIGFETNMVRANNHKVQIIFATRKNVLVARSEHHQLIEEWVDLSEIQTVLEREDWERLKFRLKAAPSVIAITREGYFTQESSFRGEALQFHSSTLLREHPEFQRAPLALPGQGSLPKLPPHPGLSNLSKILNITDYLEKVRNFHIYHALQSKESPSSDPHRYSEWELSHHFLEIYQFASGNRIPFDKKSLLELNVLAEEALRGLNLDTDKDVQQAYKRCLKLFQGLQGEPVLILSEEFQCQAREA